MGKNLFVYGENTEISYLVKILRVFAGICLAVGIVLFLLKQWVYGGISIASVLIILVVAFLIDRKQYQKIDGSFQRDGKVIEMRISISKKNRKNWENIQIQYDGEAVPTTQLLGKKRISGLTFVLPTGEKLEIKIGSLEKGVTIFIEEIKMVENNYVLKEYLIPEGV